MNRNAPRTVNPAGRSCCHIFFYPDYTVGNGIPPFLLCLQPADSTAGQEFHPASKIVEQEIRIHTAGCRKNPQ